MSFVKINGRLSNNLADEISTSLRQQAVERQPLARRSRAWGFRNSKTGEPAQAGGRRMSYTNLLYHIVYATKERAPLITKTPRPRLHEYLGGTVRGLGGIALEINGAADHVHVLAKLRPTISVSEFLSKLKSGSSGWAKRETAGRFGWQARFGAFTVSESQVERVRKYIRNQEAHHRKQSFEDEFKALLRAHRIDFDEAVEMIFCRRLRRLSPCFAMIPRLGCASPGATFCRPPQAHLS